MTVPAGIGLIGIGSIATYHIDGLRAAGGAVVRAVASRSIERAAIFARAHGIQHATDNWRMLLDRNDIYALVVATPDDTHAEIAVAAARAGKGVLLQKPMAPTVAECRAIIAAAREAGTVLEVSFMHRHFEEVAWCREFLHHGRAGRILELHLRNATSGPDWSPWFYRRARGGGVVLQLGVHGIDLLRHLVGPVEAVAATTGIARRIRTLRDGTTVEPDNEDTAHAIYRLRGGAVASHEMSFNDAGATDRFALDIHGENAVLQLRSGRGRLAILAHGEGGWRCIDLASRAPGEAHHAEFLDILRGLRPSTGTAEAGLASVGVAEAIHRAAAELTWIRPVAS